MTQRLADDVTVLRTMSVGLFTLLVAAALKWTATVTMPLFFAIFLVSLGAPLRRRLERHLPKALSSFLTFCATLVVLGALVSSLYFCAAMIAERAPHYQNVLMRAGDGVAHISSALGMSVEQTEGRLGQLAGGAGRAAAGFAQRLIEAGGALVLVLTFTMLALPEVDRWREKICRHYGDGLFNTIEVISHRFRSYVGIRTLTSAAIGGLTWLLTWSVGLDFAFVWGVAGFFLNYVPTLGGIIAIVPPSLLAVWQFGALRGAGVSVGLVIIHILIGSFIDPKLQGRTMRLSPLVVLFSIAWWGFLWGVGGALLAVPLTVSLTLLCAQFPRSAWVAELLAEQTEARSRKHDRRPEDPVWRQPRHT